MEKYLKEILNQLVLMNQKLDSINSKIDKNNPINENTLIDFSNMSYGLKKLLQQLKINNVNEAYNQKDKIEEYFNAYKFSTNTKKEYYDLINVSEVELEQINNKDNYVITVHFTIDEYLKYKLFDLKYKSETTSSIDYAFVNIKNDFEKNVSYINSKILQNSKNYDKTIQISLNRESKEILDKIQNITDLNEEEILKIIILL